MRIAGCRLRLAMAKEFANHWQGKPRRGSNRSKAVTEIVDSDVFQLRPLPDDSPGFLEIDEMSPLLATANDVGVAKNLWD